MSLLTQSSPVAEFNQMLFKSELVTIGRFHAPVDHPRFNNSGLIEQPVIAFPYTSVEISHVEGPNFQTSEKLITFYNSEQDYRRYAKDGRGDICDWFEYAPEVLQLALAPYVQSLSCDEHRPFDFACLASDHRVFLRQRLLLNYLVRAKRMNMVIDKEKVEEQALLVLEQSLSAAQRRIDDGAKNQHLKLCHETKDYLHAHFSENYGLEHLAQSLGVSPYHLCRVFKNSQGQSIGQYKNELRLRQSLSRIGEAEDFTQVALDLGFSSHSHFTSSFSRYFGQSPKVYRKKLINPF